MDSSVVTAGGRGVRGLKGNVNKYTKIKLKKKFKIKMYLLECDHLPCYFLKLFLTCWENNNDVYNNINAKSQEKEDKKKFTADRDRVTVLIKKIKVP